MKKTLSIMFVAVLIFGITGCDFLDDLLGGDTDVIEEIGKVEFSLDLAYAKAVGYTITRVQATLTHQTATTDPVQQDLTVDSDNEMATGTIHNLRTGTWDVTVELFESTTSVGSGTGTVTVTTDATAEVNIYITLDTGSASIRAYWGIPTAGLVAYYPFNGNANDESDNSNDGTVNGATLVSDRFGNVNKAYSFDGTDDYIEISDSINNRMTENFTFSVWFISDVSQGLQHILGKNGTYNAENYGIAINNYTSTNQYGISMHFENPSDYDYGLYMTGYYETHPEHTHADTTLVEAMWNHAAFAKSNDTFQFFINGTLIATVTWDFDEAVGSLNLFVGTASGMYFGESYFDGTIDDIRIYNRALTESEIDALYHEGGWTGG